MRSRPVHSNFVRVKSGNVELHLREISQLFDRLDPSPFREKDLDRSAEEYIVDSVRELSSGTPRRLVIHLDQPLNGPDEERAVVQAIRTHFGRRAQVLGRSLRRLWRRGLLSLGIGLAFLALLFSAAQIMNLAEAESGSAKLLRESMLIVGWVAMWRPLEIFLYDWWPIWGERRLHERISHIDVEIVP